MNKVILLLGDLATGKSTYSEKLGARYNCLVISKDKIKEALADAIGFKNRQENKKLSNGTFKVMNYVFKKTSLTHQDIILESNFHEDELKVLYQDIKDSNYDCLTMVLEADIDILYKRFMNRAINENRHPVHVTKDLIDYDSFKNYILESRKVTLQGKIMHIDANDFDYQNEENFQALDAFLKSE